MVAKTDSNTKSDATSWKLATLAPGEKKVFRLTAAAQQMSDVVWGLHQPCCEVPP